MLPISIQIKDQQVVIVGGGKVASRRIQLFIEQGAKIKVISPDLHPELEELYRRSAFLWENRMFHEADVKNAWIVVAATNNQAVNAHIGLCCTSKQLVNIVDDPKRSNFHFPATLKKGLLTIAATTDGASPMLAMKVRDRIKPLFDEDFIEYMNFVKEARRQILQANLPELQRKMLLHELHESEHYSEQERAEFLLKCNEVLSSF